MCARQAGPVEIPPRFRQFRGSCRSHWSMPYLLSGPWAFGCPGEVNVVQLTLHNAMVQMMIEYFIREGQAR